jgi:hypothetical protein
MESNSRAGVSQSIGHPGEPTFSKVEKTLCMHLSPSIFGRCTQSTISVYRSFPTHTFRIRPSEGISIISRHQLRTTRSRSLVSDSGVSPLPAQLLEQSHLGADVYEVVAPRGRPVGILPGCSLTVTCRQARMLVTFRALDT